MKSSLSINSVSFAFAKRDLIAAITIVMMAIPQGMAYAVIAGLPPIYGLYTCLLPLLIYPFFSSSQFLSVGPTAILSILLVSGLSGHATIMTPEYISLAIFVSLLAGIIQIGMSLLKMGFLANFLSHPVLVGFTSAAAVIIIVSQLKYALGISLERSSTIIETLTALGKNISATNVYSVALFLMSLIGILFFKKFKKSFPAALVCIVLGSLAVYFFQLADEVAIIGDVPSGLPSIMNPIEFDSAMILSLLPLAGVISFISFVESLAIAKSLDGKDGHYVVDADKELLGLGMSKFVGAFFQAFPSTGSYSRSAINEDAGAKTGLSSVFAALIIGLSLLLFTKAFYYIPYPVLAAIIISAVIKLFDYKTTKKLFNTDRGDCWVLIITFLATILLGVLTGITTGIILSILVVLKKVSTPHFAVLGKIDDSGIYRNVDRFDQAVVEDKVLIIRYDDDIFFGNANHFFDSIIAEIMQAPSTKILVLDMSSISNIDSTGIIQLRILLEQLKKKQIKLHISGPKGPLRDRLKEEGISALIGDSNIHLSIEKSMKRINETSFTGF